MPRPGRTFDLAEYICDTGFLIDFSPAFRAGNVAGNLTGEQVQFHRTRYTTFMPISARVDPSFGSVYSGDEVDELRNRLPFSRDPWCVYVDRAPDGDGMENGQFWYAMGVYIAGSSLASPTTGAITESIPMSASVERLSYGGEGAVSVTRFEFTAQGGDAAIGAVPKGAQVFLVVDEYTSGIGTANLSVAGVDQSVGAAGGWHLGAVAADVPAAAVNSAHSLTGDEKISGFALVGEKLGLG